MKWTKEVPKKEGIYWMRGHSHDLIPWDVLEEGDADILVHLFLDDNVWCVSTPPSDTAQELTDRILEETELWSDEQVMHPEPNNIKGMW